MKNTQAFTFQHSIFIIIIQFSPDEIESSFAKAFIFKYLTVCVCMYMRPCLSLSLNLNLSPSLPLCVLCRLLPMLLFNSLFCMALFTGFCISSAFGFHFMELFGSIEFHFIAWHSICEVNSLRLPLYRHHRHHSLPFSGCLLLCHIIFYTYVCIGACVYAKATTRYVA